LLSIYNFPMQLKLNGISKIRILMVCLGNICRSPLAEGILQKLIEENNVSHMIEVDSAATAGHTIGRPPDHRSVEVARRNGIRLEHKGRQLTRADFSHFDLILVMDESNFDNALQVAKNEYERGKVRMITDYDQRSMKPHIVKDPYWGELSDFIKTHDQLLICCQGLMNNLLNLTTPD
jgi:protein-tyrosine phosphatase